MESTFVFGEKWVCPLDLENFLLRLWQRRDGMISWQCALGTLAWSGIFIFSFSVLIE